MIKFLRLLAWSLGLSVAIVFEMMGMYFFFMSYMAQLEFATPASFCWLILGGIFIWISAKKCWRTFVSWKLINHHALVINQLIDYAKKDKSDIQVYPVQHHLFHAVSWNKDKNRATPIMIHEGQEINLIKIKESFKSMKESSVEIRSFIEGILGRQVKVWHPLWIQYDSLQSLQCHTSIERVGVCSIMILRGYKILDTKGVDL